MTRLLLVVLLQLGAGLLLARPHPLDDLHSVGSLISQRVVLPAPAEPRIATEVDDLLSAGARSPNKIGRLKNASGKSDEGGLYKSFGGDADGEKGYLKKSYSKGDHGYKNLDTFHKRLGDKYGFEEHEAFGKRAGDHGSHQRANTKTKSKQDKDHEGAGTDDVESYAGDYEGYSDDGGGEYHGGGDEGGDASSYNDGSAEGYSESYSSGGDGSAEAFSDGSGEDASYY